MAPSEWVRLPGLQPQSWTACTTGAGKSFLTAGSGTDAVARLSGAASASGGPFRTDLQVQAAVFTHYSGHPGQLLLRHRRCPQTARSLDPARQRSATPAPSWVDGAAANRMLGSARLQLLRALRWAGPTRRCGCSTTAARSSTCWIPIRRLHVVQHATTIRRRRASCRTSTRSDSKSGRGRDRHRRAGAWKLGVKQHFFGRPGPGVPTSWIWCAGRSPPSTTSSTILLPDGRFQRGLGLPRQRSSMSSPTIKPSLQLPAKHQRLRAAGTGDNALSAEYKIPRTAAKPQPGALFSTGINRIAGAPAGHPGRGHASLHG